ncbi:hypothetical protein EVG20_g786 [Dentipellis fragilis]|uniref:VIT domain-containing protein n=1 Tax=Dentipellis fragilis TaxID=205917 RepID=A0A4Y9ZFJ7_9AGAM|nr:hypothetical protein EVG20_g786 [Dentipellis fragilis]
MQPCTLVYIDSSSGTGTHLPLKDVKIDALVVDVSAEITISHTFTNPDNSDTGSAKYVFPLPARAAVCAFEMRRSDDEVISGVVKEKDLAAREYDDAVRDGHFAGLVEAATDDVFTMSVGSIPAQVTVVTKLSFVMDLLDNDFPDEIRLQLPMASAPLAMEHRLRTGGQLQEVTSPTHAISVTPFTAHDGNDPTFSTAVTFGSPKFLNSDFVIVVRAEGLDAPRCFAEESPGENKSYAIQLTLVPFFDVPSISSQEYLFLVDRSGSMDGSRIETARATLSVLLRSLPAKGTIFNIFGFGSSCDSIWPKSGAYDASSLHHATNHLERMRANYGGTEMYVALRHVFKSRDGTLPTAVIILTDGEDYEIDQCIECVASAVAKAPAQAPIRVFTLGIGDTASSAMCEGLARAGNGVCLMATSSEDIVPKSARLVRAAKSSFIKDVVIDWGIDLAQSSVAKRFQSLVGGAPPAFLPLIQQAPRRLGAMYPHLRYVVFTITEAKKPPKTVVLRAQLQNGQQVAVSVSVHSVKLRQAGGSVPLVPTLAARHVITDILENSAPSLKAQSNTPAESELLKAAVIRIAEQHQIVSKYTSFVAVASKGRSTPPEYLQKALPLRPGLIRRLFYGLSNGVGLALCCTLPSSSVVPDDKPPHLFQSEGGYHDESTESTEEVDSPRQIFTARRVTGQVTSRAAQSSSTTSTSSISYRSRGHRAPSTSSSESGRGAREYGLRGSYRPAVSPIIAMSSYNPPGPTVMTTLAAPSTRHSSGSNSPSLLSSGSNQVRVVPSRSLRSNTPTSSEDSASSTHTRSDARGIPQSVLDLVKLQAFDGSFSGSAKLWAIVGERAQEMASQVQAEPIMWATAVAMAYLDQHLSNERELLDGLREKVMEFVLAKMDKAGFESLVTQAKVLVN